MVKIPISTRGFYIYGMLFIYMECYLFDVYLVSLER